MEFIRKNFKVVAGSLIILILMELAVAYYLVTQFHETYMRGPEALQIAIEDAGVEEAAAEGASVKLGHKSGAAWYNIRFEEGSTVFTYQIDAENGEILSSGTE